MKKWLVLFIASGVSLQLQAQTQTKSQTQAQTPETTVTQIQASEKKQNTDGKDMKAIMLSEPQVLEVAKLIHEVEQKSGKIGKEKSKESIVTTYAQQIESDHKAFERALSNVEKKSKMSPQDNNMAKNLAQKWNSQIEKLEKMDKGREFDKAFIEHEIGFHQEALQILNGSLVNNAKNPDFKEVLAKAQETMKTNLQRAQYTQKTFSNEGVRY